MLVPSHPGAAHTAALILPRIGRCYLCSRCISSQGKQHSRLQSCQVAVFLQLLCAVEALRSAYRIRQARCAPPGGPTQGLESANTEDRLVCRCLGCDFDCDMRRPAAQLPSHHVRRRAGA